MEEAAEGPIVRVDLVGWLSPGFEWSAFVGPRKDRAFEVLDIGTAGLDQALGEGRRAPSDRAIHHDRAGVAGEGAIDVGRFCIGLDVAGSGKVGVIELLPGADIEEDDVRALAGGCVGGEQRRELGGGELGNRRVPGPDGGLPVIERVLGGIGPADDTPQGAQEQEDHEMAGKLHPWFR